MSRFRSHLVTFLALFGLTALLILLDQGQRLATPQDWGQRLTRPAETGLTGLGAGAGDLLATLRDLRTLRAENEALRAQIEQLTLINVQYAELSQENERFRELLHFQESNPNYTLLAAEVVALEAPARVIGGEPSNLVQAVRLNQGREAGVKAGMSVITPRGLIGRVQEAGEGWSKVLLVTDPSSRITAFVQQGRAAGVVEGTGNDLIMRYIPHEQRIEPGDVVLTAGLGGQFPKGLVIGVVESVERSDINPSQEATLRSTIDFRQLEYLFVMRDFVGSDVIGSADAEPSSP